MTRIGFAPVVDIVLAIASCAGLLQLQGRDSKSHDAQLAVVRAENSLNQLQGLPWEVQNPQFGTPERIRTSMDRTERSILATIDHLRRSAPAAELESLAGPIGKNFVSLDRIYAMGLKPGGWNDPGPTIEASQAENVSLAQARRGFAHAGVVYAHRAAVAEQIGVIGVIGTIVGLLAAFFFYYRRSVRGARNQQSTLEARHTVNEHLERAMKALTHSQKERAKLLARTVEVAEHERTRVAMDLHDGPIQKLTVLAFNLDRLARRIDRDEIGAARTLMADVRSSLSGEMQALRRLMVELRPPILDEGGLSAALTDAATEVLKDTPIEWSLRCEIGTQRLAPELETAVYRVVKEALVNVRKHSGGTRVEVFVLSVGLALRLVVADDGRGFDTAAAADVSDRKRFGLLGMHERVGGLGGTCRIDSHPGVGTRVEAYLPLKVRNAEEAHTHELAVA
ncbi:MAG: sensor histidine kinase [Gaiellaceae bacterium]